MSWIIFAPGASGTGSASPKNLISGMSSREARTPPAHMMEAMRGARTTPTPSSSGEKLGSGGAPGVSGAAAEVEERGRGDTEAEGDGLASGAGGGPDVVLEDGGIAAAGLGRGAEKRGGDPRHGNGGADRQPDLEN